MKTRSILISLVAIAVSFAGGFLIASALNRSEMQKLKAENERLRSNSSSSVQGSLTNDEIESRIAEADRNPENLDYQKSLGLALYRYAALKQDAGLLERSERVLERAVNLAPDDVELLAGFGHANFDIGYYAKSNERFARARDIYDKVLEKRPQDVEIQTDLALTYFLQQPPELERAEANFRKSLAVDPRHQKTLQFLVQTLAKLNKTDEAARVLDQLKQTNPPAESVTELTRLIDESRMRQGS